MNRLTQSLTAFAMINVLPLLVAGESNTTQLTQQEERREPQKTLGSTLTPPAQFTAPAGTWVTVRLKDFVSTDVSAAEDQFIGALTEPIIAGGFVLARRGQLVSGRVTGSKRAGRLKGISELSLELTQLSIVDGRQLPIRTEKTVLGGTAPTRRPMQSLPNLAYLTSGAASGASLGFAAGQSLGAASIGAAAGFGATGMILLLKRGPAAYVGAETELTFRISEPVVIDTKGTEPAFQPANQRDFESPVRLTPYYY